MRIAFIRPNIGDFRGRDPMEPIVFALLAARTPPSVSPSTSPATRAASRSIAFRVGGDVGWSYGRFGESGLRTHQYERAP